MTTAATPLPALLEPGDLAPWFHAPVFGGRADWAFNSAAGAPVLMFMMGSAAEPTVAAALAKLRARAALFDDERARFFGVTSDPSDVSADRIKRETGGVRYFLDNDFAIAKLYRAANDPTAYRPHLLLLDRALQVVNRYPMAAVDAAIADLEELIAAPGQDWAPVLTVPNLFEPALCQRLMALYDSSGGEPSGFVREVEGKTTIITDPLFKQRRDAMIDDAELRSAIMGRISRKLVPAVQRSYQFTANRIERYIVAAYDAGAGHFRPHRDNTTKGTAHRRFAVTINLNSDYDGGDLKFPEFGQRTYRAPPGGAVVFSCSLLHEATNVTRGRRYACLPFLYDDAAAAIREANNAFLGGDIAQYRAGASA